MTRCSEGYEQARTNDRTGLFGVRCSGGLYRAPEPNNRTRDTDCHGRAKGHEQ